VSTIENLDIAVIGGGAAGFFSAINAKLNNPDLSVIIFEATNKLLSKVSISGGGRCNVTHACFENKALVKNYPRGNKELLSAFHQFTTSDTIAWFADYGIELKVEADGRMFPTSDDSQTIIDCFLKLSKDLGIEIKKNHKLSALKKTNEIFHLSFDLKSDNDSKGKAITILSKNVICCMGGFHKLDHYKILSDNGIEINKPIPSLFTFNIKDKKLHQLMGLSKTDCSVSLPEFKLDYQGPLLATHWGLSGPAVLKLSSFGAPFLFEKNYQTETLVDWEINISKEELLEKITTIKYNKSKSLPINTPIIDIPKRLYEFLLNAAGIEENIQWANVKQKEILKLVEVIKNHSFKIDGKTTFKEEFVTAGGVKRESIDFKTMQSKIVPNLFFAGEIIDIDGITGGFNFQAAWTTAHIAAKNASQN
jgi:predicted Rossmann fold flavoprotein